MHRTGGSPIHEAQKQQCNGHYNVFGVPGKSDPADCGTNTIVVEAVRDATVGSLEMYSQLYGYNGL